MVDLLGDRRILEGEERRAGFDEKGNFLGLAALTEDIGKPTFKAENATLQT